MKRILITGGAGFIGSHLADELLQSGHQVRVLDNLSEQVHGPGRQIPAYLDDQVEFFQGDIRDPGCVRAALQGMEAVYHFAAKVGVGQSMYEIKEYTSVNNLGTAVLLEAITECPVEKLIVASSMSLYGEGLYRASDGTLLPGYERSLQQLKSRQWELQTAAGEILLPVPTPESKPASLASVYALSKYDQECLCRMIGRAYRIPTVALRFFNVYGTRQSLANPYTGVLAIFAARLLNNQPPVIFEDGRQQRDFVSVHDVVRAARLALETPAANDQVFNIGSGRAYSIQEIARRMRQMMGKTNLEPELCGKYRVGDIRHCFADITRSREVLGYQPRVGLEEGLCELVGWLESQSTTGDHTDTASMELSTRGLTV